MKMPDHSFTHDWIETANADIQDAWGRMCAAIAVMPPACHAEACALLQDAIRSMADKTPGVVDQIHASFIRETGQSN